MTETSTTEVVKTEKSGFDFKKITEGGVKLVNTLIQVLLIVVFVVVEVLIGVQLGRDIYEIGKIQLVKVLPIASPPVARFITKINWETRTIEFDAAPSKTFNNQVDKSIWRIDDGFSSMDGLKMTHTFASPGYYQVLFSLIDTNGQSDQADCRILFPPTELDQIPMTENISEKSSDNIQKQIVYKSVPKGVFFNYSKLGANGAGDLKSPFVETGCGFSNTAYNSYDLYQNISQKNLMLRRTIPRISLMAIVMIGVLGVFVFLRKRIKLTAGN